MQKWRKYAIFEECGDPVSTVPENICVLEDIFTHKTSMKHYFWRQKAALKKVVLNGFGLKMRQRTSSD